MWPPPFSSSLSGACATYWQTVVVFAELEIDKNNRAVISGSKERLLYLIMIAVVKFLLQTLLLLFVGSPSHVN